MAIVFISPQKKQRILFWISAMVLILIFSGLSLLALLPEIKNQLTLLPAEGLATMPDITVNFDVVDSLQVKNFEGFSGIQTEFTYTAIDSSGNQVAGTISAESKEGAKSTLEGMMGLTEVDLQQADVGRSDPFISY